MEVIYKTVSKQHESDEQVEVEIEPAQENQPIQKIEAIQEIELAEEVTNVRNKIAGQAQREKKPSKLLFGAARSLYNKRLKLLNILGREQKSKILSSGNGSGLGLNSDEFREILCKHRQLATAKRRAAEQLSQENDFPGLVFEQWETSRLRQKTVLNRIKTQNMLTLRSDEKRESDRIKRAKNRSLPEFPFVQVEGNIRHTDELSEQISQQNCPSDLSFISKVEDNIQIADESEKRLSHQNGLGFSVAELEKEQHRVDLDVKVEADKGIRSLSKKHDSTKRNEIKSDALSNLIHSICTAQHSHHRTTTTPPTTNVR